jgi:hypothetical protein
LEAVVIDRKLEKSEWRPFFDTLSRMLEGKRVEIEVASLSLGAQIEAKWLPLLGIAYDPKSDILEVVLDGHDHIIQRPREVYFAENAGEFFAIEVVDAEGTRQIVKLKDPLMLPATQS